MPAHSSSPFTVDNAPGLSPRSSGRCFSPCRSLARRACSRALTSAPGKRPQLYESNETEKPAPSAVRGLPQRGYDYIVRPMMNMMMVVSIVVIMWPSYACMHACGSAVACSTPRKWTTDQAVCACWSMYIKLYDQAGYL